MFNLDSKSVSEMSMLVRLAKGCTLWHVAKEDVEDVCRAVLIHGFVRDLSNRYDTLLGAAGVDDVRLSSEQKKSDIGLILGINFLFRQLFLSYKLIPFQAKRLPRWTLPRAPLYSRPPGHQVWLKNNTTTVITHDLSQVTFSDFVYTLKVG